MCTGFVFRGSDTIYAFNLDISEKDFDFRLIKNSDVFTVAIKVGSSLFYSHGVNKNSCFAVLPFMNDSNKYVNCMCPHIDKLVDSFIKGQIEIDYISSLENISNVNFGSLHSLFSDGEVSLLVEPGLGIKKVDKYQVISNFPLLKECNDENPFYGKDRYKFIDDNLRKLNNLSIEDALYLLKYSAQEGEYSTKVSFVYSKNNNCVYYCENRDFDNILIHKFN